MLIVDLDPQCNSTQLVLDEDQWEEIYEDRPASEGKTVMGLLRKFRAGDSSLHLAALRNKVRSERFGVDVLPGHPSLSIFEDLLSEAWSDLRSGSPAGARRSVWLRTLSASYEEQYDLLVVDVSPSLGSINRCVLVGSDAFVTPMAPDLFSLYALDNITAWFERWLSEYQHGRPNAQAQLDAIDYDVTLPDPLPIQHGFVGYTIQQYVSRSSGGEIRQTEAYEQHRREIPDRAKALSELSGFPGSIELGTIPNMFSMIPFAQGCHAPIADLKKGRRASRSANQSAAPLRGTVGQGV